MHTLSPIQLLSPRGPIEDTIKNRRMHISIDAHIFFVCCMTVFSLVTDEHSVLVGLKGRMSLESMKCVLTQCPAEGQPSTLPLLSTDRGVVLQPDSGDECHDAGHQHLGEPGEQDLDRHDHLGERGHPIWGLAIDLPVSLPAASVPLPGPWM